MPTEPERNTADLVMWLLSAAVAGTIALWVLAFLYAGLVRAQANSPAPAQRGPLARFSCDRVKAFVVEHGEAGARALAVEHRVPQWVIKRAERCFKDTAK